MRTGEGWLYLAPVLDLISRRVVGRAMSDANDGVVALAALENAARSRRAPEGLIHSDRGGICCDDFYLCRLDALGIRRSMSRTADPWHLTLGTE